MIRPKSILITGASSGIGAALAELYADNNVYLFLIGRDLHRLEQVAEICRQKGASVKVGAIDVCDGDALRIFIESCNKIKILELVVANAGVSNAGEKTSEAEDRLIFAVNLQGVLNTVYPAIDLMRKSGKGQIALMSSLAGYYGIPRASAYSASKAAIRIFGEALRNKLKKDKIKVSVICPGFVKTPLTDKNSYSMPLIISAKKAASIIASGLEKNKGLIAFPRPFYFGLWFLRILPAKLIERITSFF